MAIGRSCNSSLNFEVLLLFLLCLYAILHLQSCILNPPSDISVFPRAHATVFVNNRRPLSSLHSSHHGRKILRLPSKAGVTASTSMRCGLLSYTIYCFCMLVCCGDVQVNPGPAANSIQDAFSTVKSSGKNGITIGHTNVRGLYTILAQVKLLAFNTNLDVLAISETHLSPALKDHEIALQGYQILRRDRIGRTGGGVVIYYKDSLDCISIEKYDNPDIEATWLEVKIRSQRLLVGFIYRPPDFGGFYDIFRPILERISVNRKNVIITGDFNSNMLDNSGNGKKFKDLLQLTGFNNIIKSPTRVTENSSTVINLICTNNPPKIISSLLTFASQITNSFIRHSSLSSHAIHPQLLKM